MGHCLGRLLFSQKTGVRLISGTCSLPQRRILCCLSDLRLEVRWQDCSHFNPRQMWIFNGHETFRNDERIFLWGSLHKWLFCELPKTHNRTYIHQHKTTSRRMWDLNFWAKSMRVFLCRSFNVGLISRGTWCSPNFFVFLEGRINSSLNRHFLLHTRTSDAVLLDRYQSNCPHVSWWRASNLHKPFS